MKPKQDAFGQEVWTHLKGKNGFEIIERDDKFLETTKGPECYFSEYKNWSEHEKRAMKFAKGRVLDIGCGAGRHCLYLQRKGFNVTGIDNSPLAIKVCKKRGLKKVKLMPISEIGKFKPNAFDTIIMMGNNFSLVGNFKRAKSMMKKMYKITSQDAFIIAETRDPYKTKDKMHLDYHKFNKKRGRMPGQIKLRVRFKKYVSPWLDYLFVSKKEMKEILKETGWKVKKFIDSEKGTYAAIIEKV